MKKFIARLVIVLWTLTVFISLILPIGILVETGSFTSMVEVIGTSIACLVFLGLFTGMISFIFLGVIHPKRLLEIIKEQA